MTQPVRFSGVTTYYGAQAQREQQLAKLKATDATLLAVELEDNRLLVVDGADRDAVLKDAYQVVLPNTMKGKPVSDFAASLQPDTPEMQAWKSLTRIRDDVATLVLKLLDYQRQVNTTGQTADGTAPVKTTLPQ